MADQEAGPAVKKPSFTQALAHSMRPEKVSIQIKPPTFTDAGAPAIFFSEEEVMKSEEILRRAIIVKCSYGRPSIPNIMSCLSLRLGLKSDFIVSILNYHHFLIRFDSDEDFLLVLLRKILYIKGYLFRFFRWTAGFDYDKDPSLMPIWVSFPGLPVSLYNEDYLRSIANNIGQVLRIHEATMAWTQTARALVCIDVDIAAPLQDKIWIGYGVINSHASLSADSSLLVHGTLHSTKEVCTDGVGLLPTSPSLLVASLPEHHGCSSAGDLEDGRLPSLAGKSVLGSSTPFSGSPAPTLHPPGISQVSLKATTENFLMPPIKVPLQSASILRKGMATRSMAKAAEMHVISFTSQHVTGFVMKDATPQLMVPIKAAKIVRWNPPLHGLLLNVDGASKGISRFCHGSVDTPIDGVDTGSEFLKLFHENRVKCVDTVYGRVDTRPRFQKT
ncbi:hypothetical protein Taro_002468 [Colocasia esculenta]|uniref:DUF4283 domain-containing protein n=1 Tax=Colocasia esculenta TaxID=4460 RepID=A0A843TGM3_COLES|nr:hypothetical protein [Colocasia esculenta]